MNENEEKGQGEDQSKTKDQYQGDDQGKNNHQYRGAGQDQDNDQDRDASRGQDQVPALPFGLTLEPDPDFKGGFTIREADGFALIGKGVSYRNIDLQVETLVGYGVQEAALTAEVIDTHGATRFIQVTKQPTPSKQPFSITFITEAESKLNPAYAWVSLVGRD